MAASPQEIAAFTSPLVRDTPVLLDVPTAEFATSVGEHLYNDRGELVAMITDISYRTSPQSFEVTSFNDSYVSSVPGPAGVEIRAIGVGSVEMRGAGFPVLRGEKRR